MIPYLGDFAEDATVYIYFNTFSSNDPSASVTATDLILSDIFVYKDGAVADLVTDGATVAVDFDSRTGIHKIEIDTSAHADYSVGSDYMVSVVGITVDSGTINAAIASFSIENRYNAAADDLANATDGLGALSTDIASLSTKQDSDMVVLDASHTKTQSDIVIIDDFLDTEIATIASDLIELDTVADTIASDLIELDTVADAIKVITDQFVFTKANEVDANTQSINGAAVVGDGNATPWDGA